MIENTVIDVKDKEIDSVMEDIGKVISENYSDIQIYRIIERSLSKNIVRNIWIENPYYDKDYLSTYYCFYIKKHQKFKKESIRIHFWGDSNYYFGYMTLRPTVEKTNIGKTYLSPKLFLPSGSRIMETNFTAHILGYRTSVSAFPWMQQETDIAVCAHVAIWSILRYYGTKYPHYHSITMGGVVEHLPEDIERKIPTSAVSMQKIPDIFKIMGFSPIVLSKSIVGEDRFEKEMLTYVDSGIPVVACMTEKCHAISVIGYIKYDQQTIKKAIDETEQIIYNNDIIKELVVGDDNFYPYLRLRKKNDLNPFCDDITFSKTERFIEDIDYLIIPLYDRMQYSYVSLQYTLEKFIKNNTFLNEKKKYIVRKYIASANSVKTHASIYINNSFLQKTILTMSMPRFVWCVDFITTDGVECKTSARILIDTTCCNKTKEPWLLMHNDEFVNFLDGNEWRHKDITICPYKNFENLKEVI